MSDSKGTNPQQPDEQNPSGANSASAFESEDHKQKLIRLQLTLLLHAYKCPKSGNASAEGAERCPIINCQTMKNVLEHMKTCLVGRTCSVAYCSSSSQILAHWKACTAPRCPVCFPLKEKMKSLQESSNQVPPPTNTQQIPAHLGSPSHSGNNNVNINPPVQPSGAVSDSRAVVQTSQGPSTSDMQQRCTPLEHQPNASNVSANDSPGTSQDLSPHGAIPDQCGSSKTWRRLLTRNIRNHLVEKMVHSKFPNVDISNVEDERMIAVVESARKIEDDVFKNAVDRKEYTQLIAEKIFRFRKDMEEKSGSSEDLEEQQQVVPDISTGSSGSQSADPNSVEKAFEHLFESRLFHSINADNRTEPFQAQTLPIPSPPVSLQRQQWSQAHLHNMSTSVMSVASSSVDSSTNPSTLSGTQASQPGSQVLDNSETRTAESDFEERTASSNIRPCTPDYYSCEEGATSDYDLESGGHKEQ